MHPRAAELIHTLALRPHPEGGHFAEVFKSPHRVQRADADTRAALTSIYFLLAEGERSRWHRVAADEVWHYYEGDPLELVWEEAGQVRHVQVGPVAMGREPVAVVPAGSWQAARGRGAYTLVGCTVAPGFEFADFVLLADVPAEGARLRAAHPELADLF
ncbi:MAG TPA: cupin domain-containing protein [Gemmatimonadales bacterium]|nr:cupin domain-containing protein [Gemmatimonadales bacterium]